MIRFEIRPYRNGRFEDVTHILKQGYQRQQARIGGDIQASSSFEVGTLLEGELWLERMLGYEFRERAGGYTTFYGQIDEVVVQMGGVIVRRSLDDVFNHVQIRYQTSASAAIATTVAATDTISKDRYGHRELMFVPGVYMPATGELLTIRDGLLATAKKPKAVTVGFGAGSGVKVQVRMRGASELLRVQHINDTSTANEGVSAAVTRAANAGTHISAGMVNTNNYNVSRSVEYAPIWNRITHLATLTGDLYRVGCFGRPLVDYVKVGESVQYEVDVLKENPVLLKDGRPANPAFLKAGDMVWARDILWGRPVANPLVSDPRAILVESLVFDGENVRITGGGGEELMLAGLSLVYG